MTLPPTGFPVPSCPRHSCHNQPVHIPHYNPCSWLFHLIPAALTPRQTPLTPPQKACADLSTKDPIPCAFHIAVAFRYDREVKATSCVEVPGRHKLTICISISVPKESRCDRAGSCFSSFGNGLDRTDEPNGSPSSPPS